MFFEYSSCNYCEYYSLFLAVTTYCIVVFFFKQKTAYEMRISDWSSDVCSSDLAAHDAGDCRRRRRARAVRGRALSQAGADALARWGADGRVMEIGRASCRERVCQYV